MMVLRVWCLSLVLLAGSGCEGGGNRPGEPAAPSSAPVVDGSSAVAAVPPSPKASAAPEAPPTNWMCFAAMFEAPSGDLVDQGTCHDAVDCEEFRKGFVDVMARLGSTPSDCVPTPRVHCFGMVGRDDYVLCTATHNDCVRARTRRMRTPRTPKLSECMEYGPTATMMTIKRQLQHDAAP